MQYLLFALVAAAVTYFVVTRRGPDPVAVANAAADGQDITPVTEASKKLPYARRSFFYQRVITHLWQNWQRPLAILVVKEYATHHSAEKICQYWMKQAMEVEPRESERVFDSEFLRTYYRPEVAKQCGLTSS